MLLMCLLQNVWSSPRHHSMVSWHFYALFMAARYGHSYYRRRIWNRTQFFDWHQIQWPWV